MLGYERGDRFPIVECLVLGVIVGVIVLLANQIVENDRQQALLAVEVETLEATGHNCGEYTSGTGHQYTVWVESADAQQYLVLVCDEDIISRTEIE